MNIADKYIQYVKTKTEAEPERAGIKFFSALRPTAFVPIFFPIKTLQRAIRNWKT